MGGKAGGSGGTRASPRSMPGVSSSPEVTNISTAAAVSWLSPKVRCAFRQALCCAEYARCGNSAFFLSEYLHPLCKLIGNAPANRNDRAAGINLIPQQRSVGHDRCPLEAECRPFRFIASRRRSAASRSCNCGSIPEPIAINTVSFLSRLTSRNMPLASCGHPSMLKVSSYFTMNASNSFAFLVSRSRRDSAPR